ncbi:MAG: DUF362 domain-containing protein [Clostridia bacterium]|nr:DUF362 domain-containing protein [Clostridia bacterium]
MTELLFAPLDFARYNAEDMLPARFTRLLDAGPLNGMVNGKRVVVKMHVGGGTGYTTITPLFVKILITKLKEWGAKPFITDSYTEGCADRGYDTRYLGCPIVNACGQTDKYFYTKDVEFKSFRHADIAGHIHDADFLLDLSHFKGHGACGYGGACKNLAMGCVTHRTRAELHLLEGGIDWTDSKCTRCKACLDSCTHSANTFGEDSKYKVFFHNCTFCGHCIKVCPTGAIALQEDCYDDFQHGMALCTQEVLRNFGANVYYINFLTNITALCDCWGISTPSLVPDIGVVAGSDIVAVDKASLDLINTDLLNPLGVPVGHTMNGKGHLFEQLHGRDPYVTLRELAALGLGRPEYTLKTIK